MGVRRCGDRLDVWRVDELEMANALREDGCADRKPGQSKSDREGIAGCDSDRHLIVTRYFGRRSGRHGVSIAPDLELGRPLWDMVDLKRRAERRGRRQQRGSNKRWWIRDDLDASAQDDTALRENRHRSKERCRPNDERRAANGGDNGTKNQRFFHSRGKRERNRPTLHTQTRGKPYSLKALSLILLRNGAVRGVVPYRIQLRLVRCFE